ncbi:protein FAM200C-like [Oratosquilla oratoria]|uniref:protein FAM200C-like n=1 Tax=Oratosquilla oratoria TaxID=337810 RepID=UPI003F76A7BF
MIYLQLDESTDVSNMSQLILYTRNIKDGEIKDESLFYEALQTTTKAAYIFRLVDKFFEKHQIKWMGNEHHVLLFHTEVRWLSRGKILTHIAELNDEIAIFLREYQSNLDEKFENETLNLSLSYLVDIFSLLNYFNLSMQGMFPSNNLSTEKVEAFKRKLSLWKRRTQGGSVGSFRSFEEKLGDKTISPMLVEKVVAHLSHLETTISKYFPKDQTFPE